MSEPSPPVPRAEGVALATASARGTGRDPGTERSRLRLGLVIAAICGAIAFLLLQGLGNATTYFRNADEALAQRDELGQRRFRLQGTVVDGSVAQSGQRVAFQVEYGCARVDVRHRGDPPELFKPGIPVVLEGAFVDEGSDRFESDRILVRHTSEYRAEEADRLDLAEREREASCPT